MCLFNKKKKKETNIPWNEKHNQLPLVFILQNIVLVISSTDRVFFNFKKTKQNEKERYLELSIFFSPYRDLALHELDMVLQ